MRRTFTAWLILIVFGFVVPLGGAGATALASDSGHPAEASTDAPEQHEEGAPLGFKADLALWSLVTFSIFLWVLKRFAWGPLIEGLDRRESHVKQNIVDAEESRLKAEAMLAEHAKRLEKVQDEVSAIIASARKDAEQMKNDIVAEARNEAEATKQRAIEEIERSRDEALQQLFDHMAGNVAVATEYVLGRRLDDSDQHRLIEEALSNLSNP